MFVDYRQLSRGWGAAGRCDSDNNIIMIIIHQFSQSPSLRITQYIMCIYYNPNAESSNYQCMRGNHTRIRTRP